MLLPGARYTGAASTSLAEGWSLERLTPPSRLFGANGLRTGPDGRIYVAQVAGSQISALNVGTGELETVSAQGADIVAPDDVDFDAQGNLYATEYYDGRVSVRGTDGRTRVLRDDVPGANGITFHQGRLFIDECRIGGRLLELDPGGGSPRVLLENLPMPNAMEGGPDGRLYYPVLGTNDIWRIDPDGGEPERVAGDLGVPDAVKFDAAGYIVSTQVGTGEVLRIDPRSGERTVLATIAPGLDNLTFVGNRLFVSSFTGQITEILGDGRTRAVLPGGLTWPLDLTVGYDGTLYVSDGTYFYALAPGGELQTLGMLFSPGWPGYIRGVTAVGDGEFIVTTSNGQVARWQPASGEHEVLGGAAEPFDQLYGVAVAPDGRVVAAELGTGRVVSVRNGEVATLASGLNQPMGVAFGADGTCLVSESGTGRVVAIAGSGVETVVDGLETPQGIAVHGGKLSIVDAGAKSLVHVDLGSKARTTIARDLPVGPPLGVEPKPLKGLPPFSGPQGLFAGIAAGPDGTLFVSADAEGSVLALRTSGGRGGGVPPRSQQGRVSRVMGHDFLGLDGRVVIVSGAAGGGIGTSVTSMAARAGATVIAVSRSPENLDKHVKPLVAEGLPVVPVAADASTDEGIAAVMEQAGRVDGDLYGLVNVAGGAAPSTWMPSIRVTRADWRALLTQNLETMFFMSQAVAAELMSRGRPGSIVSVSSISGMNTAPLHIGYGTAKAALVAATRTMAVELARHNIRVNAIAPGVTETPASGTYVDQDAERDRRAIAMGRRGRPEEQAGAILFLLSDLSSYVTGQTLLVDGGLNLKWTHLAADNTSLFLKDESFRAAITR